MSWFSALVHKKFYLMLLCSFLAFLLFFIIKFVFLSSFFFFGKKMKMIKTQISATEY